MLDLERGFCIGFLLFVSWVGLATCKTVEDGSLEIFYQSQYILPSHKGGEKMAKKKRFVKESFESGNGNGNFMQLYWDMLDSKAWQELTPYDVTIYLAMKRKYQRKVTNGMILESNKDNISMPKEEYEKIMHRNTFFKSIDNLIEKGFIRVIENRRHLRKCIIYGFVDKWQEYGKPGYKIPHNWKRTPGNNRD